MADSRSPSPSRSSTPPDWYLPDPPKKKGPSFENSHQLVTLYAGQNADAKSFLIHKSFACYYSLVLNAALNSSFIEGQTQNYRLDSDNFETVRLLVHWFYTQVLDTRQPEELLKGEPKDNEDHALIQLWVLADKLLVPELQNLVLDKIDEIREVTEVIPTDCLKYVYENTSSDCPLRRWFVHQCVTQLEPEWFTEHPEHFPHEMLIELAAIWSENLPEEFKVGLMDETNLADFEVDVPDK